MIQDRPYMRANHEKRGTNVLTWVISAIVAAFIVQNLVTRRLSGIGFDSSLALSPEGVRSGHLWTLVTYGFLHSTGNLLQPIAYLTAIYFAGREVLPVLGARRFIAFYFSALASGGVVWTAFHWRQPDVLIGASAAVAALIVLYACFYPNRETTLLLFFVLPVTIKPKYLAFTLLAADLFGLVLYEVLGLSAPFYAAHSAHLGGMAAGWVYFRYIHDSDLSFASGRADIELPRWMRKRGAAGAENPPAAHPVNAGDRGHLRAEVDRILDKINSDGFGSLSADEKRVLDEARDLIGRR